MKCSICKSKKGKRFCIMKNNEICSQCCGSMRNLRDCNSNCQYFFEEKTDRIVIGDPELTCLSNGKVNLFASNCFLPNIYDLLTVTVNKLNIFVLDYGTIRLKISFIIKENIEKIKRKVDVKEAYLKDAWKKLDNGVKEEVVPLFQIYTNKSGKSNLNDNQYKLDKINKNIIKISKHLHTFLPYSKNQLKEVEIKENGIKQKVKCNVCSGPYFQGKNDTYYGELKLNTEYEFDVEVEYEELLVKNNLLAYFFGINFPFELVNIHELNVYTTEDINTSEESVLFMALPIEEDLPQMNLIPLEGNENSFTGKIGGRSKFNGIETPFHYDKYAIMLFDLGLESNNDLLCKSIYRDYPLLISCYESLNNLYEGLYAPIKVSLVNNTNNVKNIDIEVKIENLSDVLKKKVTLLPKEFKLINLCPVLNNEEKNKIEDITNRNIKLKVKSNESILIDETHEIVIFPKNLFVFSLQNKEKDWKVSLLPHIARFITPHDKEINDIYSNVARKMVLRGYSSNNRECLISEIKAFYDILSEEYELEYTADANWYGTEDYKKQGIKLPREVIKDKCGNCMEFTLLLASCLEKLNIETAIVLIPEHAFLGVKLFGNEKIYIETTMIGKRNFEEAVAEGIREYNENFRIDGSTSENSQIIEIQPLRREGIFPIE